jgi:hypothetical protein
LLPIAHRLTPRPSRASVNPLVFFPSASAINFSSIPVTPTTHLDLNDRMKVDLGNWGNIVHPHGPNYFCLEHRKQLEEGRNRSGR